jgi:hypothetical protein
MEKGLSNQQVEATGLVKPVCCIHPDEASYVVIRGQLWYQKPIHYMWRSLSSSSLVQRGVSLNGVCISTQE